MGVISGVVYLGLRLSRKERPITRADDARQLARARATRGEITAAHS